MDVNEERTPSSNVEGKGVDRWIAEKEAVLFNKHPGGRKNADGSTSYTMRFPVLKATEWVEDPEPFIKQVAEALNVSDRADKAALTNAQKEITLLRIIDAMGGVTDSSEHRHQWLNWFCSDEIHNVQDDTFNRCNKKGWLNTTHNTDFDTSTTTLTDAGRAALSTAAEGSTDGR